MHLGEHLQEACSRLGLRIEPGFTLVPSENPEVWTVPRLCISATLRPGGLALTVDHHPGAQA